ncbi:3058_t:CDS:2 [Ambispora leptoticha]|uniref:3058_t:CDS:1 n=1 Tax=Ambispora leptoticha TaxID=144679 RepID=A0A9N9F6I6_9GLOM|nr:3058_t:CDS:2 [Ambispora leptoticha]
MVLPSGEDRTRTLPDSNDANLPMYCLFVAFVSVLTSFQNGWNTSVTNMPEHVIRGCENRSGKNWLPDCLPMNNLLWGFAVGSYALGGLIGGLSAGHLQTKFGRRRTLMFNNVNFLLGALIQGISVQPSMFVIGRLLTGIGSGIGTVTVPTYLGEIATINARGFFGTINQIFIVTGIVFTQAIGFTLDFIPGWRILLALTAAPALAQILLLPFCVESPRYLISQHKIDEAREALKRLRHGFSIDKEFDEIVEGQREIEVEETSEGRGNGISMRKSLTFVELFKEQSSRKMTLICLGLSALQQLCGINGIIIYSNEIFSNAFHEKAKYATVGMSVTNLITTISSLGLIDKKGRRPLLLSSEIGMSVSSILVVVGLLFKINILIIVAAIFFVITFSIGLGPIPFLIIAELAPTHSVSATASAAMGLNWFCNFLVGWVFPVLIETLQGWTFLVFAIITSFGFVLTYMWIPETKGRSIEAISREIREGVVILDDNGKTSDEVAYEEIVENPNSELDINILFDALEALSVLSSFNKIYHSKTIFMLELHIRTWIAVLATICNAEMTKILEKGVHFFNHEYSEFNPDKEEPIHLQNMSINFLLIHLRDTLHAMEIHQSTFTEIRERTEALFSSILPFFGNGNIALNSVTPVSLLMNTNSMHFFNGLRTAFTFKYPISDWYRE